VDRPAVEGLTSIEGAMSDREIGYGRDASKSATAQHRSAQPPPYALHRQSIFTLTEQSRWLGGNPSC